MDRVAGATERHSSPRSKTPRSLTVSATISAAADHVHEEALGGIGAAIADADRGPRMTDSLAGLRVPGTQNGRGRFSLVQARGLEHQTAPRDAGRIFLPSICSEHEHANGAPLALKGRVNEGATEEETSYVDRAPVST